MAIFSRKKEKKQTDGAGSDVSVLYVKVHREARKLVNDHLEIVRYVANAKPFDRDVIRTYTTMEERLAVWTEDDRRAMIISGPGSWPELRVTLLEAHLAFLGAGIQALKELPQPDPPDEEILKANIQVIEEAMAVLAEGQIGSTRKIEKERPTHCHICCSTNGPFRTEPFPDGLTDTPLFAKCQECVSKRHMDQITLDSLHIKGFDAQSQFAYHFRSCADCGALFWVQRQGLIYAWYRFGVDNCPICDLELPTGADAEFEDPGYLVAYMTHKIKPFALDEASDAFHRLTAGLVERPNLSRAVERVLLCRKDVDHHELVVIGRGLDDIAAVLLERLSGHMFSMSARLDDRDSFLDKKGWALADEWTGTDELW